MKIILAPMEGVVDHTMRAMLTQVGGIDRCVTEFVRITSTRLPSRVFYRYCPELHNNGLTPSGIPVYVQLLGGQAEPMALNALRAATDHGDAFAGIGRCGVTGHSRPATAHHPRPNHRGAGRCEQFLIA